MIKLGKFYKPFVIAELSGNHNGSIKEALNLVKAAARCKVDAVKIQTYTADTMTLNSNNKDFVIKNKSSNKPTLQPSGVDLTLDTLDASAYEFNNLSEP